METKTILTTLFAALVLAGSLCAGTFSSSTTAPAVQATDIANLGAQTGTDKWFFRTSNEAGVADAAKGQTFTTGPSAVLLKAVTYKISAGNMKAAPTTYTVRAGTVSGTSFTQIPGASETYSQTVNTAAGGTQDTGAIQAPAAPVGGVETVTVSLTPALLSNPKLFIRLQAAP